MVSIKWGRYVNFLEVRDTKIPFAGQGLVIITGKNGVGKSSLFTEGPFYGLFGESLRYGNKPAAAMIRNGAKSFAVLHEVDVHGEPYLIARCKKFKEEAPNGKPFPDGLSVWHNGVDEARGHTTDTQEWLNKLLGMSPKTFQTVGLFTGDTLKFPLLPDSKKKEVMDELLQLGALDDALEITKASVVRLDGDLVRLTAKTDVLAYQGPQNVAELERLLGLNQTWDASREARLKTAVQTVLEKEAETEALKADVVTIRTALQQGQSEFARRQSKIEQARTQLQAVREDFIARQSRAASAISSKEREVKLMRAELKAKADLMGTRCSKCNQPVPRDDAFVKEREEAIATEVKALEEAIASAAIVQAEEAGIKESQAVLAEAVAKLSARQKNIGKITVMLDGAQDKAATASNHLATALAKVTSIEAETNPYLDQIDAVRQRIASSEAQLNEVREDIQSIQTRVADEKLLQQCFSNKGARVLLLEKVVPSLNLAANGVRTLLETPMVVSFNVRGDDQAYAGSFEVIVDNPGKATDYRGDSTGERRRIDMILMFSLIRLAAKRGAKSFDQAVFDEPFENIDEEGQQGILRILQHEARVRDSLFVITHAGFEIRSEATKIWIVYPGGVVDFGTK